MSRGCDFYADALVELARGQLGAGRVDRVERHLAECAECRSALEAIHAVRSAPAPVPEGLERRIQAAVRREATAPQTAPQTAPADRDPTPGAESRGSWRGWRAWALPLAAAAALAIWLGGSELLSPDAGAPDAVDVAEYEPYGEWPASDAIVAGDLVLSELSVDELEAILEEM